MAILFVLAGSANGVEVDGDMEVEGSIEVNLLRIETLGEQQEQIQWQQLVDRNLPIAGCRLSPVTSRQSAKVSA